jgi:hypothetical protein
MDIYILFCTCLLAYINNVRRFSYRIIGPRIRPARLSKCPICDIYCCMSSLMSFVNWYQSDTGTLETYLYWILKYVGRRTLWWRNILVPLSLEQIAFHSSWYKSILLKLPRIRKLWYLHSLAWVYSAGTQCHALNYLCNIWSISTPVHIQLSANRI